MVNQFRYPEKWRVLDLSYASAHHNLALEEALFYGDLSNDFNPTVRLWVNPAATVIGRFQDVKSEVDVEFCIRNGIQVVRRFTGGGAVYHDGGNLNFTIVMPKPENIALLEFHRINASIIQDCVNRLGLESEFVSPNSIEVSSKKISGAAACFNRKLALWHSSILVSTDTAISTVALAPSRREAQTTYVRSRWKPMATLEAMLGKPAPLSCVKTHLLQSFQKMSNAKLQHMSTTSSEERLTLTLLANKYSRYEWNYLGTSNCRGEIGLK
jgi:lipoate-protein ligase A